MHRSILEGLRAPRLTQDTAGPALVLEEGPAEPLWCRDELLEALRERGLEIIDHRDHVPWSLREHARWYRVCHDHCVLARLA